MLPTFDPPAEFEIDGPFSPGARITARVPGRDPWVSVVKDVGSDRTATIEIQLSAAAVIFMWQFEELQLNQCRLTQSIMLAGENAAQFKDQIVVFEQSAPKGLKALARSIVHAEVSSKVNVRSATAVDWDRLIAFYKDWDYRGEVTQAAIVLLAEREGELIGIVRIEPEHGEIVLRGMRVAGPERRRGIGLFILKAAEKYLGSTRCWCIAYAQLRDFYGRIGFKETSTEHAPQFLKERIARYRSNGDDVVLLIRGHDEGK